MGKFNRSKKPVVNIVASSSVSSDNLDGKEGRNEEQRENAINDFFEEQREAEEREARQNAEAKKEAREAAAEAERRRLEEEEEERLQVEEEVNKMFAEDGQDDDSKFFRENYDGDRGGGFAGFTFGDDNSESDEDACKKSKIDEADLPKSDEDSFEEFEFGDVKDVEHSSSDDDEYSDDEDGSYVSSSEEGSSSDDDQDGDVDAPKLKKGAVGSDKRHTSWINWASFDSTSVHLITCSADDTAKIWVINEENEEGVAMVPDLVVKGKKGKQRTRKQRILKCQRTVSDHNHWVTRAQFSTDGRVLTTCHEGDIGVFKFGKKKPNYGMRHKPDSLGLSEPEDTTKHMGPVTHASFSPDGQLVASCSADKTVKLWRISDAECFCTFEGHTDTVNSVEFSPSGFEVVSASHDQTTRIWSIHNGDEKHKLGGSRKVEGHTAWVNHACWNPAVDGSMIATCSGDGTALIWKKTTSGKKQDIIEDWEIGTFSTGLKCVITGHDCWVLCVRFSPRGELLATSSADCKVMLYSVYSGARLQTLDYHKDWVECCNFSTTTDPMYMVTTGYDRKVCVWRIKQNVLDQLQREESNEGGTRGGLDQPAAVDERGQEVKGARKIEDVVFMEKIIPKPNACSVM